MGFWALGFVLVVASSAGLAGCPRAAELEDPDRFERLDDAATVPPGCEEPLPASACDAPAVLQTYCSRGGCHNRQTHAAGLNLMADNGLIARILEVPATHDGSLCPGLVDCDASMKTCEACDTCPENALLVDRDAPMESWILKKMESFIPGTTMANEDMRCGVSMPSWSTTPSVIRSYDASHKECLTEFFLDIAMNTPNPERWPCTPDLDAGTGDPDGGTDGGT